MKEKKPISARATIELNFLDEKIAESICRATAPENSETPKGTQANSCLDGQKIIFQVEVTSRFRDLITTIEDFFEKVEISRKTINLIEKE